jgi:D-inositol-3-phosphate glycosyltransferase
MLSVHTSPLHQPGAGNAGGMNVYVVELARRLARLGVEIDVFTRATSSDLPPAVEVAAGVTVRHVAAGPYETLPTRELPAQLCAFTAGVLRAEARHEPGWYDMVHSHYWLSGHVGWLVTGRWGVPLVHSMHTMSKVKNMALAEADVPEPRVRELGEEQVVAVADMLVANTDAEAGQLVELYGASPSRVSTVWPGVDLGLFKPGPQAAARARLALPREAVVLLFAGRIQPLKAPDVLVRAVSRLLSAWPELRRRLVVAVVGAPSGVAAEVAVARSSHGADHGRAAAPYSLPDLVHELGLDDVVRLEPPVEQTVLADWYRAADLTVTPSYNESFGLVALESQACATPVVAAAVGGLRTAVHDGVSGVLVKGHDPADWATVLAELISDPARRRALSEGAMRHATRFGWDATAARMLDVYTQAMEQRRLDGTDAA